MRHFLKNEKLMEDNCLCLVLLYEMVFGKGVNMREKNVQRVVFAAKKDIMAEVRRFCNKILYCFFCFRIRISLTAELVRKVVLQRTVMSCYLDTSE